ncbi:MAG: SDR family oxidoreductase [Rhodospirillaceae bacterium]|jgi:3-oxoacyl-[acyl-carrier protein] reductase|nr:SDR family oxidoreductase [Rhodospirillaceae bacterium]MBT3491335.1 SDR family oxidoreductase [Rhodospirillaceae bacterium]MBT3781412.1 SDR family oxidoreductase [Rhodospirillaceae bacterium]MBT3974810.1 SDR family oxidoreductase [Rhodospirillaceae bacterium]MBT4167508.1 SDR family oxidoreductase [Rhodospirillaceae bacterium]
MDLQLAGRVALVTGASIGLGASIAEHLAAEGCRLALLARRAELLEAVANAIAGQGHERPMVIVEDVTADGVADRIGKLIEGRFGHLDILINNAGGSRPMPGLGTEAEWEEAMLLNFSAGRRLAQTFVPGMQARKFGRIVNITGADEPVSMNAAVPPNGAVHIWAKSLSRLVGGDGVTVNCIPPGRIHSEQIDERLLPTEAKQRAWAEANCPAGYIGEPEDLSVLVAFLCSPRARYINGQVIHVDGGARHFSH